MCSNAEDVSDCLYGVLNQNPCILYSRLGNLRKGPYFVRKENLSVIWILNAQITFKCSIELLLRVYVYHVYMPY